MRGRIINPKKKMKVTTNMNKENNKLKNNKLSYNLNLNEIGLYISDTYSQSINVNIGKYINILNTKFNTIDNDQNTKTIFIMDYNKKL